MSDQAIPPVPEAPQAPAKPKPTPMTVLVESTELYANDILFFATMNDCFARMDIVRVIATEGTSVSHLARHWCKRNNVKFTLVLLDDGISPRDDRARRIELLSKQGIHFALFFNQFDFFRQFADALHGARVPVNFVHAADEMNRPKYITWTPGMTNLAQTPTMKDITKPARRARHAQRVTEEHKKQVKRECTARHDEKRRLIKLMKRMQDGTLGQPGLPRRRGRSTMRPMGHTPTMS